MRLRLRRAAGVLCVLGLLVAAGSSGTASAAETRTAIVAKGGTFACTSWAAWREFTAASLRPKGARYDKACPRRLKAGLLVEIVEDDAGAGAAAVRANGRVWYIDAAKLVTAPRGH